ncbi:MAG: tetratricopeptide repeat protein [Bacteroidales bacterium]|nr:tetratricopeptide repeat protein [Bacteroidales bacterium]
MRKNVVLTAIAILLCMPLHAQKLKKAFDLLKQSEYDEAEILFNRATKNKVEPAAAYFALGKILIDQESGRYDTYKAFEMFQNSKDKFLKTPPKTADNKTMYFISEAHYGMGGTDIFMTQRTDSTWRHWTAPINLGKYINTPFNEFDFSITADGRTAVYTSEDPVTQERIIYRVTLPPALRPDTVAIYSGEITDLEGNPLSAQITVDDTKRTRRYATYNNQPDGSYYFGLPQDSAYYRITVSVKGLLPQTDYLDAMWGKPITRTHNFVMFSEADIFESCLAVPLTAIEFKSSDLNLYGAPDEEIKRMSSLFKKHNCDTLQLIVSAPQRHIAQQRADAIAYLFQQNGIKTVLVAIKVGKDGVMIKRM